MSTLGLRFFLVLCCCLPSIAAIASVAIAANHTIQVEWGYTPPSQPAVTGFNLYQEGTKTCQTTQAQATSMACQVTLTKPTTNFTLTATFSDGTESPHSAPFPFTPSQISNDDQSDSPAPNPPSSTPPTAVISSSTAAGQAPLTVHFHSAESMAAPKASIIFSSWFFGDGTSRAYGTNASHTFTTPGTYQTVLTVLDSNNQISTTTTPIVVTAPDTFINAGPTPLVSTTQTKGPGPLTVSFDGSASSDRNGSITSYRWNFGDGQTATGRQVTHTYTTRGLFNASLEVTNSRGEKNLTHFVINVQGDSEPPALRMELGEISVGSQWLRVLLDTTFINPIVVAGPPTSLDNGSPPTIRLSNITAKGFDIRLEKTSTTDSSPTPATVHYLVMEQGRFTLANGSQVEAGTFTGSANLTSIPFSAAFHQPPVVITAIATTNTTGAIIGSPRGINGPGFSYALAAPATNTTPQGSETIHYLAWEPGAGTMGDLQYIAATTAPAPLQEWTHTDFPQPFTQLPLLLADTQTCTTCTTLAAGTLTPSGFQMFLQPTPAHTSTTSPRGETLGYLALAAATGSSQPPTTGDRLFTFTWDYPATNQDISGFRFYLNSQLVCATDNPQDRTIRCQAPMLSGPMRFTMTAVHQAGGETNPSNLLLYDPSRAANPTSTRQATFTWDFDPGKESTISGFLILANNTPVCALADPGARQLDCPLPNPTGPTTFTIRALSPAGPPSRSSNAITYRPW
ncbi:PKD domain-containing protein [Desulfobulbus alkaliphilus]|uniref:PKD domain-containing protein n=1 Tax=Desulfobulbus alkaliphilus TaxID=869814 RepID=UPI001962AE88|nr:PKD domain-containing protein [Desulfobulbus alkaliphilus]MBM9538470.1 PKD domain-containing protein [Desulfobulbus alkaliphilus]